MKKIISILLTIAVVGSMTGCSIKIGEEAEKEKQAAKASAEQSAKEAEELSALRMGDTVTFGDFEITVNSAAIESEIENSEYTAFKPDEGNVYIVVNADVKNIGTDANQFLPVVSTRKDISVKLKYGKYDFQSTNLLGFSDDLHSASLNPLSSKSGILAFEVAEDIADLSKLNFVVYNNKEEYRYALTAEDIIETDVESETTE